jgi:hypothetical protein
MPLPDQFRSRTLSSIAGQQLAKHGYIVGVEMATYTRRWFAEPLNPRSMAAEPSASAAIEGLNERANSGDSR